MTNKSKFCFLDARRSCEESCMAYDGNGKHSPCRLLNATEKLTKTTTVPFPTAPPPKVTR